MKAEITSAFTCQPIPALLLPAGYSSSLFGESVRNVKTTFYFTDKSVVPPAMIIYHINCLLARNIFRNF